MKIEVNQLSIDFSVLRPVIPSSDDLEVRMVFTNTSGHQVKLNTLFLGLAFVVLEIQTEAGTPAKPGKPPMPPFDDGKEGRVKIAPGKSFAIIYRGSQYLASPLPPGKYKVRFRYQNELSEHGDWTGKIETEWMNFEVHPDKEQP